MTAPAALRPRPARILSRSVGGFRIRAVRPLGATQ